MAPPATISKNWPSTSTGRIPHAWIGPSNTRASTLDLVGGGLTLLGASPDWSAAAAALKSTISVVAHTLDDATAQVLGIARDGAVPVRPDGKPIARWPLVVRTPTSGLPYAN